MNLKPLWSSVSAHWETPAELYQALDKEFGFTLDPCPLGGRGGLERSWEGERVYCNPPYGRDVGKWLVKAPEADIAIFLLPARTDTKWWHEYAMRAEEIRFLRGRLKFSGSKNSAPFPSVVLIYRRGRHEKAAARDGHVGQYGL
jgi:site-specific DNA-methyltransferase (adenine-specific)